MDIDIETLSPRTAIGVGLLALIPVLWYAIGRPSLWGYVSAINIVIISISLYIALQPVVEQQANEGYEAN